MVSMGGFPDFPFPAPLWQARISQAQLQYPSTVYLVVLWLITKGGLISESFSLWLQSPQKCAKSQSWTLYTQRKDPQDSIWKIFWDIGANVKNFLRLFHLYIGMGLLWHPLPHYLFYTIIVPFVFSCSLKQRDREMPKNNTTNNDSSHQTGRQNRVPITSSDTDGNEKQSK